MCVLSTSGKMQKSQHSRIASAIVLGEEKMEGEGALEGTQAH
jgi:hypothetical protein